jgi:hypothetical protein
MFMQRRSLGWAEKRMLCLKLPFTIKMQLPSTKKLGLQRHGAEIARILPSGMFILEMEMRKAQENPKTYPDKP